MTVVKIQINKLVFIWSLKFADKSKNTQQLSVRVSHLYQSILTKVRLGQGKASLRHERPLLALSQTNLRESQTGHKSPMVVESQTYNLKKPCW